MSKKARSPEPTGRRVGRPPKIDRAAIAQAASEVGLADLTLKAVADHLGVSVAGLYHHIEGKDDLKRLAAEYSVTRVPLPEDTGQHWALWLLEWAAYNLDAFMNEPALLVQYLEGGVSAEAIADNVDAILGLLVRQGFDVREAMHAYAVVSSLAIGSAVNATYERESAARGRPLIAEHYRVLAQRDLDELPHLRMLVAELAVGPPPTFTAKVRTALVGIAVERGEDPTQVTTLLEGATIPELTLS